MTDLPTEAQRALDEFDGAQSERDAAQRLAEQLNEQEARRG